MSTGPNRFVANSIIVRMSERTLASACTAAAVRPSPVICSAVACAPAPSMPPTPTCTPAEASDVDVVPIADIADEKLRRLPSSRAVVDDPHVRHGPERPGPEVRPYVP